MRTRRLVVAGTVTTAIFVAGWTAIAAQQRVTPRGTQFNIQLLRPSGGPVVPIFEGWYENPDGTYELSFGYFNVNTEEVIDIPLGPDNFIEPKAFDGRQSTHFRPVPDRDRRHYGVFTVTVPEDFGDQDVVWSLRVGGQTFSAVGHLTSANYRLNEWIFAERRTASPLLKLDPAGPQGRGPAGITTGPLGATVGRPVPLTVWTTRSDIFPDDTRPIDIRWVKHRGPGDVAFSPREFRVAADVWKASGDGAPASTAATFSGPGQYVLRGLAHGGEFESHCCWTNGYVEVTVR